MAEGTSRGAIGVRRRVTGYKRAMPTQTASKKKSPPSPRRPRSTRPTQTDAIALLKQDHREVKKLFDRFEKAGDGAHKEKRKLVDQMIAELSRHASIEEQILYPWAREYIEGSDDDVLEAIEEHHVVKWLLWELEDLDPTDERFDAKVTVMIENVKHHIEGGGERALPGHPRRRDPPGAGRARRAPGEGQEPCADAAAPPRAGHPAGEMLAAPDRLGPGPRPGGREGRRPAGEDPLGRLR